jgi:hypothetical protein
MTESNAPTTNPIGSIARAATQVSHPRYRGQDAEVRHSRRTSRLAAIVLAVVFTTIYLLTRTADYSVNAVRAANDIVAANQLPGRSLLFHPGYLLFAPLGDWIWSTARLFHYTGGPLPVLASINCAMGGIGIGLLSLLLRAVLTRSKALTVLAPIALGFSFGYWMLATDGRPEMPGAVAAILAAYALVRAMILPTPLRASAAGGAVAFAILLHIFAVVLVVGGAIALCVSDYTQGTQAEENRARQLNVAVFLLCAVAPVAIVYAAVGFGLEHLRSVADWRGWILTASARDWWFNPHPLQNLRLDIYAFRRALFVEPGAKSGTFHIVEAGSFARQMLYWAALVLWFFAVYAILSTTAFLVRTHYRSHLIVALTTGVLYAIGFVAINPGNFVYWDFVYLTPVMIVSSIVMGICCSYYRGRRAGSLWLIGLGCWIAVFGASNLIQFILPHMDLAANPRMAETRFIESRTSPGDVFVVSGFGDDAAISSYLPYFGHRTVFCIGESLQGHSGSVTATAKDLSTRIKRALAAGHHAYASGELWEDETVRERLRDEYAVRNTQQLLGNLQRAPAWRDPENSDLIVWKLLAAQSASTTADAP